VPVRSRPGPTSTWRLGDSLPKNDTTAKRELRYDERKAAYEDFYTALSDAEQDTLNLEAKHGLLPGDMDYELGYKTVDKSLARLQFMASDDCLAAAEKCSGAFFAWGWSGASHTKLYEAMNEFVTAVRADLDVNALSYKRPLPTARKPKASIKDAPPPSA
jgi:hypothetical protein